MIKQVPNWVAVAAFRYSLGRMTYVVRDCCDFLEDAAKDLEAVDLKLMIREIDEAVNRREAGMQFDVDRWLGLRASLVKELVER